MSRRKPNPQLLARLGERLRTARRKAGLKQDEAAGRVKIEANTLSRYERGSHDPPATLLEELASIYGITVDSLIGEDPVGVSDESGQYSPTGTTRYEFPELTALEQALVNATDEQRAKLLGLVAGLAELVEGKD